MTAAPMLTREQIEEFHKEYRIGAHPDGGDLEPWAVESNAVLSAICNAVLSALDVRERCDSAQQYLQYALAIPAYADNEASATMRGNIIEAIRALDLGAQDAHQSPAEQVTERNGDYGLTGSGPAPAREPEKEKP